MNWSSIRSHFDQVQMLRRSLERGRLAHAYLFAGPAGIGKARFARIFAQCLLCQRHEEAELETCEECSGCRQMNADSHPDYFYVSCPEGKSEIPVEQFTGGGERRLPGLIHDLALRPMAGERRIAIIDDANRMNEEGANGMLKTLEEPPPHSVLVLIAENLDAVLPTVRSRCQVLRFSPLSQQDVTEILIEQELTASPEEALAAAQMSEGSLRTAAQLLRPELKQLREQLSQFLSKETMNSVVVAKTMLEGIEAASSEASENRRNIGWLLRFAQEFYRQAILHLVTPSRIASAPHEIREFVSIQAKHGIAGIERTMGLLERVAEAERQLDGNVAPARTLEVMFDDLSRRS